MINHPANLKKILLITLALSIFLQACGSEDSVFENNNSDTAATAPSTPVTVQANYLPSNVLTSQFIE